MLKVEGGENSEDEKLARRQRSTNERAIQAIVGAGVVYVSNSATDPILRILLFFGGIAAILHAIFVN